MQLDKLITFKQLIAKYPNIIKTATLRKWILNKKENGLQESNSMIKIGKIIFFDEEKFAQWLLQKR